MSTTLIDEASNEIAEYNATETGLAELRARMANVHYDCTTVKGMIVAKADRAEVRGLRTGLETMRKQIKAPALAHCKLIDAEAARITTALLELETPIDAQIKARELVLENERLAREAAERDRINAIHAKIADMRGYHARAAMCRTAAQVDALLGELSRTSLGGFEEFSEEAAAVHLDSMKRVEAMLVEKHLQEEAAAKLQAEQAAAAAQLAKERAELAEAREALARQVAEAKAQADAIAAKQLAEAIEVMVVTPATAPVIAPIAPVVMRRPPPARTVPPVAVIAAPVARVYTDDVPTSADIYAMTAESETADNFAKWLCTMAGVAFPPVNQGA